MKHLALLGLFGLVLLICVGCATTDKSAKAGGCPSCAEMKAAGTGWCDGCGVGMVDGKKTECKDCYVAKTGGPACAKCN
ncbi:MAG: hypothetical protein ACYTG7_08985 [Planctomycetota bacterium]|jgi:hypothetical protein